VFGESNTGVNSVDNYIWTDATHFSEFSVKGSYVPITETEDLILTLYWMPIEYGIKNSLLAKLGTSLDYLYEAQNRFINGDIEAGNQYLNLAVDKLVDFINEVEAQRGKKITEIDANILINGAQEIIVMINDAIV
jgi:hypothetical protein